ncbi:hypothetical protein PVBG_03316 [Plasmodium vivax Brazil I]|uniref:VIR protein n=1 Tax=Plasmodium vivax (strain Brazil I) TaxID=1033975 RepID=A0A0J9SSP7_PLAV1|nr:hypothetical protein PVBG_03316 [Plasmodium vivax Brazil I]
MFKLVYDLSEDYETYRLHFIKSNPTCDKDFDEAIKSYKFLYKDLRKKCTIERTYYYDQYCDVFNEYFTEDKNDKIFSWSCQLRETEEQVQRLEKGHREDVVKEHIRERPAVGRLQVQGNRIETAQNSRTIVSYLNKDVFDEVVISSASEESSRSTTTKSITSAVSAAGVLVPPFLIYNYAPARSWINKLLRMNKGTNRNPYANQELIADFPQPEDFYSERNRYNIMYNPE